MRLPAKKSATGLGAFLLVGAVSVFMAAAPHSADARGGRGISSGGFSRSSPASDGSLSSRATVERPVVQRQSVIRQDNTASQARTARNTGDIRQPRAAGSANGAQSVDGVQSDAGAGQTRAASLATAPTAAEMAAYRQQFQQQNQDRGIDRDRNNWDEPVDPDYGVPVTDRPVVPAVVVGATARAIAINRADDVVDYVNTVSDPTYLAEDACSLKAMTAVNDVTYYRCSDAWYKRGYHSGNVVYIPTDPPANN